MLYKADRNIKKRSIRENSGQYGKIAVNTDKILTRLSVHTEKYCPKQKIVSPELARAIRFLLRAIFQVWTDKRVNIVLINSCHTILYPFMSIVITVCYCL